MIINIRGTSGSGKTHLVREVMYRAGGYLPVRRARPNGRGLVAGYTFPGRNLTIIGNYEATCGGCDKFSWRGAADWVQEFVSEEAGKGRSVIFEGLLVGSWALERWRALKRSAELRVVLLSTPLEECLAGVRRRREARGDARPLDPGSTTRKHAALLRGAARHAEAGLSVHSLSRGEALASVTTWLGLL